MALKYVVSHPAMTAIIPVTAKLVYLCDNLGAGRGPPLPDEATRKKMVALLERRAGFSPPALRHMLLQPDTFCHESAPATPVGCAGCIPRKSIRHVPRARSC